MFKKCYLKRSITDRCLCWRLIDIHFWKYQSKLHSPLRLRRHSQFRRARAEINRDGERRERRQKKETRSRLASTKTILSWCTTIMSGALLPIRDCGTWRSVFAFCITCTTCSWTWTRVQRVPSCSETWILGAKSQMMVVCHWLMINCVLYLLCVNLQARRKVPMSLLAA